MYLVYYCVMNKNLLKRAIKKIGNQTKLADYLSVSKQFISMVKNGRKKMPAEKVIKLNDLIAGLKE